MRQKSPKVRYGAFCADVEVLLETANLLGSGRDPRILGLSFFNAARELAALHFPDDSEFGVGPRGLICDAFRNRDQAHPVQSTLSLAHVMKSIVKYRPSLDVRPDAAQEDLRSALRQCPFYDEDREYDPLPNMVFVLMPFDEPWSDTLWKDHLRVYLGLTANGQALDVKRADDMFGQGVMEDVIQGIVRAGLVVGECTRRNPNVLYELGLAHALGKRTALLSRSAEDIPFDLRRFRFCVYQDDQPGYSDLEHFLRETVREVFGDLS